MAVDMDVTARSSPRRTTCCLSNSTLGDEGEEEEGEEEGEEGEEEGEEDGEEEGGRYYVNVRTPVYTSV